MPCKAMILSSDSMNPHVSDVKDIPLYVEVRNGRFSILDVEDAPCLTLTADGLAELADPNRLPMDALPHVDIRLAPPCGADYGGF